MSTKPTPLPALLGLAMGLALTGCSGQQITVASPEPTSAGATQTVSTPTAAASSASAAVPPTTQTPAATAVSAPATRAPATTAPASTQAPATTEPGQAGTAFHETPIPLPSGYQPGGPLPANATKVTSIWNDGVNPDMTNTGIIINPTGDIGCDMWVGPGEAWSLVCAAKTWESTPPSVITEPGFGQYYVMFADGTGYAELRRGKTDPFAFDMGRAGAGNGVMPQIVDYGQTVYYGPTACTSEAFGLSCWNYQTGHGAVLTWNGLHTF